ncbi:patatin-like phospholipase family protein [Streptomyces sp. H10-C2]|uniref:patatin-like phospholipase family protein n=1 Tax=unclassified Streptomyces TaxID=2593676 RepID=UPI0024BAD72D|nr:MULTISPECIES: patatin-like phospholipase family protein [unclassified Streptomyces]MDJ0346868.1 patatin-like phospholipase family protein [Streptomyces sp. PH10-H1]MDJ0375184.1 patatin-like phospholipase family protein [Streptomyces sp. H10-C2]
MNGGTKGGTHGGTKGTALVLGGGGVTGVGWEIGMIAGLAEAGVDLGAADVVIGTSAGSIVGAQLTSGRIGVEELYERQLVDPAGEAVHRMSRVLISRYIWAAVRSRDARTYLMRMGRIAGAARRTPTEAERRAVISGRLVSHDWPDRRLLIAAVDAESGEFTAFDSAAGIGIVDAVGASCAVPGVWPPISAGGRRWIDGGVRSSANADLAAGYERVVVLAPVSSGGGPVPTPRAQAAALVTAGARVVLITPDRAARAAFGPNVLDPARRAAAARAGRAQSATHAGQVRAVWCG